MSPLTTKSEIFEYLGRRKPAVAVLSTVRENGVPHGAAVFYAITERDQIAVVTEVQTRKWHDIQHDNRVSLVFGFTLDESSVQCEGTAELLQAGTLFEEIGQKYFDTVPEARPFSEGTMGFILVTPKCFRATEYRAGRGPEITEVT